eukprot:scaffold4255_cov85-Isochrysis_galbana.AAC.4
MGSQLRESGREPSRSPRGGASRSPRGMTRRPVGCRRMPAVAGSRGEEWERHAAFLAFGRDPANNRITPQGVNHKVCASVALASRAGSGTSEGFRHEGSMVRVGREGEQTAGLGGQRGPRRAAGGHGKGAGKGAQVGFLGRRGAGGTSPLRVSRSEWSRPAATSAAIHCPCPSPHQRLCDRPPSQAKSPPHWSTSCLAGPCSARPRVSPVCPLALQPHDQSAPSSATARVWCAPTATRATATLAPPGQGTGVQRQKVRAVAWGASVADGLPEAMWGAASIPCSCALLVPSTGGSPAGASSSSSEIRANAWANVCCTARVVASAAAMASEAAAADPGTALEAGRPPLLAVAAPCCTATNCIHCWSDCCGAQSSDPVASRLSPSAWCRLLPARKSAPSVHSRAECVDAAWALASRAPSPRPGGPAGCSAARLPLRCPHWPSEFVPATARLPLAEEHPAAAQGPTPPTYTPTRKADHAPLHPVWDDALPTSCRPHSDSRSSNLP